MNESMLKELSQALAKEFKQIGSVVDFVHGKEQFMKPLAKADEELDKVCKKGGLNANESEFRFIVDMFMAIIEKPVDRIQTNQIKDGFQRIFETVKAMLVKYNEQWEHTP